MNINITFVFPNKDIGIIPKSPASIALYNKPHIIHTNIAWILNQ